MKNSKNILAVTSSDHDLARLKSLFRTTEFDVKVLLIGRQRKFQSLQKLLALLPGEYDLIFLEGSSLVGTIFALWAKRIHKIPIILSSGDPMGGFFKITKSNFWGWIFGLYEKFVLKNCDLFLGWTPYLTGRALSLGTKKAFTLEGGVDLNQFKRSSNKKISALKRRLCLKKNVIGVCGSLIWSKKQQYSYGLELVNILKYLKRQDVSILIIGDGPAKNILESKIKSKSLDKIVFTGNIASEKVADYLSLLDIGFVTQTLDDLGNFRLTTKLPEYLACGVTVAMSPIPGYFDYLWPNGILLPNLHPASDKFHKLLAKKIDDLDFKKIKKNLKLNQTIAQRFDYEIMAQKLNEILKEIWQK